MGSGCLLFLLEPALLDGGGLAGGGLALDLDLLALVGGQFAGKVGLLRRLGRRGSGELLDVLVGVTSLDGGGLVGLELAEVQVLDGVGCGGLYPGGQRRSGRCGERPRPVPERHGRTGCAAFRVSRGSKLIAIDQAALTEARRD